MRNVESGSGADDRVIVGYFADGADASRAINELIDEGFIRAEIGAAFRSQAANAAGLETNAPTGGIRERAERNPATSGSVGGAASDDQAVQPAGLAPGSGNAFPAPVGPGPIPGGELPRTLPHDLPSNLPARDELAAEGLRSGGSAREVRPQRQEEWRESVNRAFSEDSERGTRPSNESSPKFGTGEGHLFADNEYLEPEFENSFTGMGLSAADARGFSASLSRGGAVVSVSPADRASLAEAILERNHGHVRFEEPLSPGETLADSRVTVYGRMRNYYRGDGDWKRRKAS